MIAVSDSLAQLVEQQPSKLWVLGSNPNGITKVQNNVKEDSTSVVSSLLLIYS